MFKHGHRFNSFNKHHSKKKRKNEKDFFFICLFLCFYWRVYLFFSSGINIGSFDFECHQRERERESNKAESTAGYIRKQIVWYPIFSLSSIERE